MTKMAGKALQPLPLGRRIFLKLGLVILLLVFSIQLVAFMCMRSSLRGSFRRNAEVSSALLALQTKEALQAKVPGQLDELLRSAKNSEPDILYLVAFDAEGEVLSAEGIPRVRIVVEGNKPVRMLDDPAGGNAEMVGNHVAGEADAPRQCPAGEVIEGSLSTEIGGDAVVENRVR